MKFPRPEDRPETLGQFVLVCVVAGIGTVIGICLYACYLN
jgi:hypothetical protein